MSTRDRVLTIGMAKECQCQCVLTLTYTCPSDFGPKGFIFNIIVYSPPYWAGHSLHPQSLAKCLSVQGELGKCMLNEKLCLLHWSPLVNLHGSQHWLKPFPMFLFSRKTEAQNLP